jgi:small nuclear ribonucleoprotein (snRNP)-like protein
MMVCSVRGHLDGFIRSFDKYFNLLLHDVDEEYITNKVIIDLFFHLLAFMNDCIICNSQQKKRVTVFGKFTNQHNVLHR